MNVFIHSVIVQEVSMPNFTTIKITLQDIELDNEETFKKKKKNFVTYT